MAGLFIGVTMGRFTWGSIEICFYIFVCDCLLYFLSQNTANKYE